MSLDADAVCLPTALTSDSTPDALPDPWIDAVPYYAAYLCYANSSRKDDAKNMLELYNLQMREARSMVEGSAFVPDHYDDGM